MRCQAHTVTNTVTVGILKPFIVNPHFLILLFRLSCAGDHEDFTIIEDLPILAPLFPFWTWVFSYVDSAAHHGHRTFLTIP